MSTLARTSTAQGWITLPNGELGYITDYTTTGFFQCGGSGDYMFGATCNASGNSLTLGNGLNSMTFTFHGLSQVIMANNARNQRFTMGTVTKSFSGPGQFVFPNTKNINDAMFYFSIVINTSFPINYSQTWQAGYLATSPTSIPKNCCEGFADDQIFPVTPPPPGFTYGALIFNGWQGSTITVTPEDMVLTATAGVTPEPSTIVLTGTGAVSLLPLLWRRRRKLSLST